MGVDSVLTGNPEFDKLEIVKEGFVTEAAPTIVGSSQLTIIDHNLGYIPVVIASDYDGSPGSYQSPLPRYAVNGLGAVTQMKTVFNVGEDTFSILHAEFTSNAPAQTFYYILLRTRVK